MPIFFIQFEARPMPNSTSFDACGGAYINCWVNASSVAHAQETATTAVRDNAWSIISVEEPCHEVTENNYDTNDSGLAYYRQAFVDGECYVYHRWSNEPQEEDDLH